MLATTMLLLALAQDPPAVTIESLLRELADRRALAELPRAAYTENETSSYDRASNPESKFYNADSDVEFDPTVAREDHPAPKLDWFANADAGNFLRVEDRAGRRESVLMDAAGPGAVVRIWSANPKGTLRVYLDGAVLPVIEHSMRDLLDGSGPVPPPLAAQYARGSTLYLPIPYAQRCVITCDSGASLCYHCEYRTYEAGTVVATLQPGDLDRTHDEIVAAGEMLTAHAPDPAATAHPFSIVLSDAAGPGAIRSFEFSVGASEPGVPLDSRGPRAITELAIDVAPQGSPEDPRRERALRSTLLSLTFDGVETVRAPVGDFFGSAPGLNPFTSFPFEVRADGTMLCRFAMPYREKATLRLTALGSQRLAIAGSISTAPFEWSERTLYFHASWRHASALRTRPMSDWNCATLAGRGVYVGDALSIGNPSLAWWGEGDDKIYVDGEGFPSHFGTGTDNYYGCAWSDTALFGAPFHAQTRCDGPQNFGYTSLARFRALDVIPFARSLSVDRELWHWAVDASVSLSATTYFYGDAAAHAEVEPVESGIADGVRALVYQPFRIADALEGEQLTVSARSDGLELGPQTLSDTTEGKWSGGSQLWVRATRTDQFVELALPVGENGRYRVVVYPTRSWDYGKLQFSVDGAPAGEPIDTFNSEAEHNIGVPRATPIGEFDLKESGATLRIQTVGTNPRSRPPHYYFGLDCVVLEKVGG